MRRLKSIAILSAVSMTALVTASSAFAGSFAIREQSATGQGMSFAGVAAGSAGVSSMFWNPATVTMKPGWNSEWHGTLVDANATIRPSPATAAGIGAAGGSFASSGDLGDPALVPASYSSYQVNDRLWIGLTTGAPFGFRTKSDFAWAGQAYGRSAKVTSFSATPTIGYRVNDWLTLGLGLQVQYLAVNVKRAAGISPLSPSATLDGDDYGFGYTVGATITPFKGTDIGIGFRSSVHYELDGTLSPGQPGVVIPVRASLNLPETLTVGLSQQIGPQWKLLAGLEWTNWSRLNRVAVKNQLNGAPATGLMFEYDDGWFASIGAEYAFSPNMTLRAGLGYEWSPISDRNRDVRIPDNDRLWASVGGTYKWSEKLSFDVGYTHIFVKDTPINLVPGNPNYVPGLPFVGAANPSIDIVSVALKYRWDDPVAAPVRTPIVAKY